MNLSAFPTYLECALDFDILYSGNHSKTLQLVLDIEYNGIVLHKQKHIIYMLTSDGALEIAIESLMRVEDGIKYVTFDWSMENFLRTTSEEQVKELIEIQIGNDAFISGYDVDSLTIKQVA